MIASISSLSLHSISMKDVIYLLIHLLTTQAKLIRPGHAKDSLWSVDLFRAESITLKTHWIMVVMDQSFFWTATDLENKLRDYQAYYNEHRCHSSRDGTPPVERGNENIVGLNCYRWEKHCRGLFELPIAV